MVGLNKTIKQTNKQILKKEGKNMKRIKAACIMQTVTFRQKEDSGLSAETLLRLNREEAQRYKDGLVKSKTRFRIDDESESPDGSVIIRIRKEYNGNTDIGEYFD